MRAREGSLPGFPRRAGAPAADLLWGIDARALVLAWGAFALTLVSVAKFDAARVLAFAAPPVFVVVAARLPARRILRRLLALSPFVCLVAAANPFLDRRPAFALGDVVVGAGVVSGLVIAAKAVISLLAVLTLVECVSFYRICEALRRLGVPEPFTTQLLLLYRYAFLLGEEALRLERARDLRSFGRRGRGMGVSARLIGTLLLRAAARSERVHLAMLARGFAGTLAHGPERPLRAADTLFLGGALMFFALLRTLPWPPP